MVYANLNESKICNGYSNLSGIVSSDNVVYLPEGWNEDLLWRKWENGQWSAEKFAPVPDNSPSEIDQLKSQNADIIFALVSNNLM